MVIALRDDYDAARLWQAARDSDNAGQVRRLLALAAIYDGVSRADAGQIGGVTRQIVRDWVLRFNADGADGLIDRTAPGKPPLLGPAERAAFAAAIEDGPAPAIDGVVRWRLVDLVQWVWPPPQRWSGLVWRRGQGRAEEQDHPPPGATRHPPQRAAADGSILRLSQASVCSLCLRRERGGPQVLGGLGSSPLRPEDVPLTALGHGKE